MLLASVSANSRFKELFQEWRWLVIQRARLQDFRRSLAAQHGRRSFRQTNVVGFLVLGNHAGSQVHLWNHVIVHLVVNLQPAALGVQHHDPATFLIKVHVRGQRKPPL